LSQPVMMGLLFDLFLQLRNQSVADSTNEFILIRQWCPNFVHSDLFWFYCVESLRRQDKEHRFKSKVIYLLCCLPNLKWMVIAFVMLLIHFRSEALMVLPVCLHLGKTPLYHPTWAILPHNVQDIQVKFFCHLSPFFLFSYFDVAYVQSLV